jgi:hypothetical protein
MAMFGPHTGILSVFDDVNVEIAQCSAAIGHIVAVVCNTADVRFCSGSDILLPGDYGRATRHNPSRKGSTRESK